CVTTVIAFSAMYLIGGRFGTMISDIPTTVSIVLIASLAECFLVLPNHMRHAVAGAGRRRWYDAPSRAVNRGFDAFKARAFRPFMRGVIRLRYPVLGGAVLLLALSVELVVNRDVAWRFWSAPERGSFVGNVAMMAGAQREDTLAQAALLEDAVREVGAQLEAEHGRNPIVFTLTQVGGNAGRGLSIAEDREKYQLASVSVELIDAEERPYSSYEVARMVQDRVRRHPLAEVVAFRGDRAGPGGDSLSVRLFGSDAETLKAASETFKRMASAIPEVTGLEDTLAFDKTELTLELTPLGRALGFTPEDLGDVLFNRLSGKEAAEFPVDRQTGRIVVILHRLDRTSDYLERARLRAPNGSWATLSEIVDMTASPGFSTLRREDGRLTVSVSGEIVTEDPLRLEAIERALEEEILPAMAERHAVEYVLSGLKEQERQFLGEAQYGMWAGLAGIYVALAWVFASWTRPLAVLLAVPFGLIGAIWGHLWWDVSMSMFSIVGLIGMIGIIINDSIVLVTTIDEYAARRGMKPAVLDAVCDRLRPVLLTTLTTVFGLMPMLYESSQQAQFLKPTIITLAYGLGFGMVIVLLVTPALAMMQRDVAAAL
ncbi:MAG: efflux RND transporter permease subunit, partial [Pseudomonadota bacterium]